MCCRAVCSQTHSVSLSSIQRGKEEYKLAATSDGKDKKGKKGKNEKDMDDLKKEVDLVSTQTKVKPVCNYLKQLTEAV